MLFWAVLLLLPTMLTSLLHLPPLSATSLISSRLFSTTIPSSLLPSITKKLTALTTELTVVRSNRLSQSTADLITSSLHTIPANPSLYTLTLFDYTLPDGGKEVTVALPNTSHKTLGGRAGAKDYAASLYLLCRKSKRGESTLTDLIEKCELASAVVVANMGVEDVNRKAVEKACKGVCKVVWEDSDEETTAPASAAIPARKTKRLEDSYREFLFPPAGPPTFRVYVGRNRAQNDKLSFKLAREGDVWMHARGRPGAHVLVRRLDVPGVKGGGFVEGDAEVREVWQDALQYGANLSAFYSDLRLEKKAPISTALPKHIKKPPNAPVGAVTLRKEMFTLFGDPDDVPAECKEKREEGKGKKTPRRS